MQAQRAGAPEMYREHSIAVVVPAYNEEILISRTVTTMPDFVDHIVVAGY